MPTINFFWDEVSDNVLVETDQNNQVVTTYIQRPEKFGKVLYHKQGNDFAYYHYDGSGSTRTLTDNTQSVTKTYIFSGYGELIASSGSGSTPFAYKGAAGYYTNPVTNDIYVRARTYQPTTGRWLSKDPLEFVDGPNLYKGYFVPRGIDPSGLSECFLHASWFTIGTIERANPKPGIPPWVARIRDLACVRKIQDAIRDLWRGVKESKDCPIGWAPCCYTDVFRFERRYLFDCTLGELQSI